MRLAGVKPLPRRLSRRWFPADSFLCCAQLKPLCRMEFELGGPPVFFLSLDSKEFNFDVSPLEATLARWIACVENKGLSRLDFG